MITYIYLVKCPNCEDELFDFFDDAKSHAMGCLSQKPIITQTEVCRNDFGECTDHCDLGTIWSWEDMMGEGGYTEAEPTKPIFTKDDLKLMADGKDPEFDAIDNSVDFEIDEVSEDSTGEDLEEWINISSQGPYVIKVKNNADGYNYEGNGGRSLVRIDSDKLSIFNSYDAAMKAKMGYKNPKSVEITLLANEQKLSECRKPIPEGMTIEQLVEEMEENEDTVECTWCEELFDKSECRKEVDLGWLCGRCEAAIKSRGETLTFRENNYWYFLDEDVEDTRTLAELVKDSINHLTNDLGKDPWADDFADDVIKDLENNYDTYVPEDMNKYSDWCSAVACEVSRQVNNHIEEAAEVHDLGNEYDGGYPTDKPELPEDAEELGIELEDDLDEGLFEKRLHYKVTIDVPAIDAIFGGRPFVDFFGAAKKALGSAEVASGVKDYNFKQGHIDFTADYKPYATFKAKKVEKDRFVQKVIEVLAPEISKEALKPRTTDRLKDTYGTTMQARKLLRDQRSGIISVSNAI